LFLLQRLLNRIVSCTFTLLKFSFTYSLANLYSARPKYSLRIVNITSLGNMIAMVVFKTPQGRRSMYLTKFSVKINSHLRQGKNIEKSTISYRNTRSYIRNIRISSTSFTKNVRFIQFCLIIGW
jgi:hypothetical protein